MRPSPSSPRTSIRAVRGVDAVRRPVDETGRFERQVEPQLPEVKNEMKMEGTKREDFYALATKGEVDMGDRHVTVIAGDRPATGGSTGRPEEMEMKWMTFSSGSVGEFSFTRPRHTGLQSPFSSNKAASE